MSDLAAIAAHVLSLQPMGRRTLVAISGPPASGKSTLAGQLVDHLGPAATLVPMDGYHLDNSVLTARNLLARKGAPETFDSFGFAHMINRLSRDEEVITPTFIRARDIAIAGTNVIGPATQIAVIEGNYLLLNEAPWSELQTLWDYTIALDVPARTLRQRLIERWQSHGHDMNQATARAEANDLPNALRVIQNSVPADMTLKT